MSQSIPTRKHCTKCKHWLLTCINFHVAKRDLESGEVIRVQSWCIACRRKVNRINEGRRKRGFAYNALRRITHEDELARDRRRNARRQDAKRKEDPHIPLKPLARFLAVRVARTSKREVANELYIDESYLQHLISMVEIRSTSRGARIVKRNDIRHSTVDSYLARLGLQLWEIYPWDEYPEVHNWRKPKNYPRGRNHNSRWRKD